MISRLNSAAQIGRLNRVVRRKEAGVIDIIPTDVSDLLFWYDFADADNMFKDAGTTKVSTNGDEIYRINDKSGNGYYAEQYYSSARAIYTTSAQNGLSGGKAKSPKSALGVKNTIDITKGDMSVYVLYKLSDASVDCMAFDFDNAKFNIWCKLSQPDEKTLIMGYNSVNHKPTTNITMVNFILTSSLARAWVNGSQTVNTAADWRNVIKSTSGAHLFVRYDGSTYGLPNGSFLYELFVYTRAVTDNENSKLMSYLNNKWDIY